MGLRDMVGPLDIRISDSGTFTAPDMFESLRRYQEAFAAYVPGAPPPLPRAPDFSLRPGPFYGQPDYSRDYPRMAAGYGLRESLNAGTASRPYDGPPWARDMLAELRALDVSRFPMRMAVTFGVEDYGMYGRGLNASATGGLLVMTTQVFVTERDGDRATMITFTETIPVGDPASGRPTSDLLAWARSVLRRVVLHELDECLYVGGERRWDPHAGGRNDF